MPSSAFMVRSMYHWKSSFQGLHYWTRLLSVKSIVTGNFRVTFRDASAVKQSLLPVCYDNKRTLTKQLSLKQRLYSAASLGPERQLCSLRIVLPRNTVPVNIVNIHYDLGQSLWRSSCSISKPVFVKFLLRDTVLYSLPSKSGGCPKREVFSVCCCALVVECPPDN